MPPRKKRKQRIKQHHTAQPKFRPGIFVWCAIGLGVASAAVSISLWRPQPAPVTHELSDQLVVVATDSVKSERDADERRLDPRSDGWDSEVTAEEVKQALLRLLSALGEGARATGELDELATADFSSASLRPPLVEAYRDNTIIVSSAMETPETQVTRSRAANALEPLIEILDEASQVHPHVKVIRVGRLGEAVTTTSIIEVDGQLPDGMIAIRAVWDCGWRRTSGGNLQIRSIQPQEYSEVRSQVGNQRTWLVDATQAVIGNTKAFKEQLAFGLNHWLPRIERVHGMHAFARWGLAVGDVNGDQLDDVVVCQPGGLPNRLYVRNADGTAAERSTEFGIDLLDHTSSALLLDLDNDGDQDAVLATSSGLLVLSNEGGKRFELQTTLKTTDFDFMSLSASDYDVDGDLDVYACIEFPQQGVLSDANRTQFVYHDANDGAANALFRNDITPDSPWKFVNVTEAVGLDARNRRHSLAAAWEDFDNDGDQDLYVANDYGQNCLYRNDAGEFAEIAAEAGVVDSASGMSVSWGDYNRDGWMDLYVANMFSSAGNRITRQAKFKANEDGPTRAKYRRFAKGNSLFANNGGDFNETSSEAAVEMGRWAWSSLFADLNNDGWEDLVVANGYISTDDTGDL